MGGGGPSPVSFFATAWALCVPATQIVSAFFAEANHEFQRRRIDGAPLGE